MPERFSIEKRDSSLPFAGQDFATRAEKDALQPQTDRFRIEPSREALSQAGIPTPEEEGDVGLSFLAEFGNVPENLLTGLLAGGIVAATGGGALLVGGVGAAAFLAKPFIKRVGIAAFKAAKNFTFSGLDDLVSFIGKRGGKTLRALSTSSIRTEVKRADDIGAFGSILPTSNRIKPDDSLGREAIDAINLTDINVRLQTDIRNTTDFKALEDVVDFNFFDVMDGKDFTKNVIQNPKLTVKQKLAAKYLKDKFAADRKLIVTNLRDFMRPRVENTVRKSIQRVVEGAKPNAAVVDKKLKELIPDDWGIEDFLPHIFPGEHIVVDKFTGLPIATTDTILEAKLVIQELAEAGALTDANDIIIKSRSFLDADSLSGLGANAKKIVEALETGSTISKNEVKRAMGGKLSPDSRPKWWASLQKREGVAGFTTDMQRILKIYNSGIERWLQLSKLGQQVNPLIAQVEAQGRVNLANELKSLLRGLWGHMPDTSRMFDQGLQKLPLVNLLVAPRALDRWTRHIQGGFTTAYLKFSPRFQALNALQTAQTLWPIVSNKEFFGGLRAVFSKEGKSILKEFNIDVLAKGGKLWETTRGIGPAENFNQKLAFLTMFKKGLSNGLARGKARDYALLRGNLYTQFLGLQSDVPRFFRTAGTRDAKGALPSRLRSSIFMFKRFPVKDLKIMADLMRDKNFVGAGKWMGAHLMLGGMKFLTKPFGIATGVGGVLMYNAIKEKYGTATADFIDAGAPGLIGLDMSGSIQLIDPPFGNTLTEKAGNLIGGPIGALTNSVILAAATKDSINPDASKRIFDTLVARVPALKMLDGLRRLWTEDYDFNDPKGRLRFRGNMFDVLAQAGAFRTLKQSRQNKMIEAWSEVIEDYNKQLNKVAGRLALLQLEGGTPNANAYQEVIEWNARWPEFAITGTDIQRRVKERFKSATTPRDILRIQRGPKKLRGKFLELRRRQQTTDFVQEATTESRFRVEKIQ